MPSGWKRLRYRLEWLGLLAATKLVPLLPRKACFHLANFLGAVISVLDRHGRKVALSNLGAAFGSQLSISQRQRITRESFQHFARTMLDLLWSSRLTSENFSRYIDMRGLEEAARAIGPDHSFIMAVYHYSNFEWLSLAGGYVDVKGTIIAQEFKNPLLDPIFKKIREQSGHQFIPRERGIIRLYKVLRRKGITALLVDLTVPPDQGAVAIECLGLKTSVTATHAWLHQRSGVPIMPAHCEPLPGGNYRVIAHPIIANTGDMTLGQIAQACWNSFEPYLRKNPGPWLWMYKHWRYKPADSVRPYPFYAHVYDAFDDLLDEDEADVDLRDRPSHRNL